MSVDYSDKQTVAILRRIVKAFYRDCFYSGIGHRAHAFVEFAGVMSKYVDLAHNAEQVGIPLYTLNEHSGVALPVRAHDLKYLGEKLRRIFGPAIDTDPEVRKVFYDTLFPEGHQ